MPSIPVAIVQAAITDRKLRAGLRLFYWFKANCAQNFILDAELKTRLLEAFSPYEIEKNLAYLKQKYFVTTDKNGRLYLQGASFYRINFNITFKKYKTREILPEHLATRAAWKAFIQGTAVGCIYYRTKRLSKKKNIESHTASINVGGAGSGHSSLIPISLAFIMSLGVAKSTASNIRKNAAAYGHIQNTEQVIRFTTPQSPDGIRCPYSDWLAIRGNLAELHGAKEASKIVWKQGQICVQLPNLVSLNFSFARKTSK